MKWNSVPKYETRGDWMMTSNVNDKVLLVLEAICNEKHGLTYIDIVNKLSLPKSTTHRILDSLKRMNFVSFDENTERYSTGLKVIELGVKGLQQQELVDVSIDFLKKITEITNETSFLSILIEPNEIIHIYKVESSHSIRTGSDLGIRRPFYATAVGKIIVAHLSDDLIQEIVNNTHYNAFTKNTLTDPARLLEELSGVKKTGYAMDHEEIELGLTCFAVPVFNQTDNVIAAISLGGPTDRMMSKEQLIVSELQKTSIEISKWLGYYKETVH